MHLNFQNPGFAYSLNSIMGFQKDGETPYWSDSLYYFYPDLDKEHAASLNFAERCMYIEEALKKVYQQNQTLLEEKLEKYTAHWQKYEEQIIEAFSEAFGQDLRNDYNNMIGNITLNPVGPRFLENRSFDIFYLNSERGALGVALHEIVHFVWFDIWHQHFCDDRAEYERPHLKWILSEMVVESIMRDERLSGINPYFRRDYENNQNGCVYGYFYTMNIEGRPILETLYEMYRSMDIIAYMETGYAYCKKHEQEIRRHIKDNEGV